MRPPLHPLVKKACGTETENILKETTSDLPLRIPAKMVASKGVGADHPQREARSILAGGQPPPALGLGPWWEDPSQNGINLRISKVNRLKQLSTRETKA